MLTLASRHANNTCHFSTHLLQASAPHSATVTEFCTAAWGNFLSSNDRGGQNPLCFLIHSNWQSPKNFQNLILPMHIFPAICAMKFPFLFFLPSISSYHALTMHWTELLLIFLEDNLYTFNSQNGLEYLGMYLPDWHSSGLWNRTKSHCSNEAF